MRARRSLGRQFGWLWAAYAISTFGTWLAFDTFPLIMGVFNPVFATYRLDHTAATESPAPCPPGRSPARPPSRP